MPAASLQAAIISEEGQNYSDRKRPGGFRGLQTAPVSSQIEGTLWRSWKDKEFDLRAMHFPVACGTHGARAQYPGSCAGSGKKEGRKSSLSQNLGIAAKIMILC